MKIQIAIMLGVFVVLGGGFLWYSTSRNVFYRTFEIGDSQRAALVGEPQDVLSDASISSVSLSSFQSLGSEEVPLLIEPITEFRERITKKPFGIHITPETSPVEHDRFAGYHTGVDIEYGDVALDVPVVAIADGEVVVSKFVSGYGGVVVVRHDILGEQIFALYGHLDPASLIPRGGRVKQGGKLGVLGEGHSQETDGVRKHLHFAILRGSSPDLRGYVKGVEELRLWYDPLDFYIE